MRKLKPFRQGFTKEQMDTMKQVSSERGIFISEIVRHALDKGLDSYQPTDKLKPEYTTFNLSDETLKKIKKICKKNKIKPADLIRDVVAEYVKTL